MKRTLLRGGISILPSGRAYTNLLLEDGKIVSTDASYETAADEIIDCDSHIILPGAIDDQVHFREPGLTHKEDLATASRACAAGGVTSFLEMPNTKPSAITIDLLEAKYTIAATKSIVNFGFYMGATCSNLDQLKLADNVPGIKIFLGSSTGDLLVDEQAALERIFAETKLPICAHCEDETTVRENQQRFGPNLKLSDHSRIRDHKAAVIATKRAFELAKRHRHRFHLLHTSTADELPLLEDASPYITAEVCPHHLYFSIDDYERLGSLIQMNPSIKTVRDNEALWAALLAGTIQVVATDHAPHTLEEKNAAYPASPSGLPAVENYLALLCDEANRGRCTWEQIASWTSDAPARVWGLVGKGRIAVGYDADLAIINPIRAKEIRNELQFTKSKWSPWNGVTLTGWPVRTIVNGQTVYIDDCESDQGKIISTQPQRRLRCDHHRGGFWATKDGIGL
ncbi:MAG: dihydroorotase [Planctomycetota bacterium]|nr:dihydroorotase [Planctomycetota bacterium]